MKSKWWIVGALLVVGVLSFGAAYVFAEEEDNTPIILTIPIGPEVSLNSLHCDSVSNMKMHMDNHGFLEIVRTGTGQFAPGALSFFQTPKSGGWVIMSGVPGRSDRVCLMGYGGYNKLTIHFDNVRVLEAMDPPEWNPAGLTTEEERLRQELEKEMRRLLEEAAAEDE